MKFLAVAAFSAYAAASPIEAIPADSPPRSQIQIGMSTYSGNGCPQGSVSTIVSDDRSTVTFGFDSFQAFIGPKAKQQDGAKNCALHLNLRYPGGFQMSVMDSTFHGYARLDDGVTAALITSYFFSQDASHSAHSRSELRGPEYRNGKIYEKKDVINTASVVWSPCGANGILNINNRIALSSNNRNAEGEISTDDATIKFTQKVAVAWRRCNGKRAAYVIEEPEFELNGLNSTVTEKA